MQDDLQYRRDTGNSQMKVLNMANSGLDVVKQETKDIK